MKLKRIKLYNSVKLGSTEYKFIDINGKNKDIVATIKGNLIKLVNMKENAITYTSMFNTVWFEPEFTNEEFEKEVNNSGSIEEEIKSI